MKLLAAVPWIACTDVAATIAFFEEKLGFAKEWTWDDPPTDGGVARDAVRIYLFRNPELATRSRDAEITIQVEDVDALYNEHQDRGAPIEMTLRNEPWGSREYHVREINGYKLRFSGESNEVRGTSNE